MIRLNRYFFSLIILFIVVKTGHAQVQLSSTITKKTEIYAIKDQDTLRMDILKDSKYGNAIQPCLMFVFGGGFAGGTRDNANYTSYFNRMTDAGFTIISIDYRLLLASDGSNGNSAGGVSGAGGASGNTVNTNKISYSAKSAAIAGLLPAILNPTAQLTNYKNAINAAVDDLFTATLYILNKHTYLQIDTSMVILSGSSAGAITIHHAVWEISNRARNSVTLPQTFSYKGAIGFAGAILAGSSGVSYGKLPCPTLFIHGNKDEVVPYGTNNYVVMKLVGSSSIVSVFKNKKFPYQFVTVDGGTHDVSTSSMTNEQDRILSFIQKYIIEKQPFQIDETI